MSNTYRVDAKRWEHGWELHVEGVGVTQSKSLHSAARMAREYISLVEGISDESTIDVEILPKIDAALGQEVIAARKAVHELAERQREVAALSRAAAKDLAGSGLSGADIAVVLDVSPQRVSQLLRA
ncbi:MAG: sigma-70 RNA polymerase sigma factor region 4 domain-containing protein [Dermatophilaceae bacterium]